MFGQENEMSIPYYSKNNYYFLSSRNQTDDYSHTKTAEIDMTLSGKYLGKYPVFHFDKCYFDCYSSDYVKALIAMIRRKWTISSEIIIGAGSNGILQNLVKLFFSRGGNLVTPFYTFHQAEYAVTALNGITRRVFMDEEKINFDYLINSVDQDTKMIYICNPNNPTGVYVDTALLLSSLTKVDNTIPIVIDESGIEFTGCKSCLDYSLPSNVFVLRSFSKAFGLANLRVGYMCCSEKMANLYRERITINEVSGISCYGVMQCLMDDFYLDNVRKIIYQRQVLIRGLNALGILTYESDSNTILTRTSFECEIFRYLEEKNVSVIKVMDLEKQIHMRIAVQDGQTNKRFLLILEEAMQRFSW